MGSEIFTLPALQKNFVNIFFVFAWELCIEKWRGFLVNFFLVSVSHETKHEKSSKISGKIRSKIRGKIRDENSKNSGNFRSATFLTSEILFSTGAGVWRKAPPDSSSELNRILDGPNRQSLAFSERSQVSQAILQVHVEQILHQRTPIARFESQGLQGPNSALKGRSDRQRKLVLRITAITLASDSAITLARFRPSKDKRFCL